MTNVIQGVTQTTYREIDEFYEYGIFVWNNRSIDIIKKTKKQNMPSLSVLASTCDPFNLSSRTRGGSTAKNGDLRLYSAHLEVSHISPTPELLNNKYTKAFKVLCPSILTGRAGQADKTGKHKVLSNIKVLEPNEVCTESYIVIGCFEHKSEAKALYAYLRTSFARYLLLQAISSLHITRERFVFVPLQDFTSSSDIDWSLPSAELDQRLFDKYGLTEDERAEILKTISPM